MAKQERDEPPVIPLNASAIEAVARMLERADLLGHTEPGHYLWPDCQWGRYDPTKPMLQWDTAWRPLRDGAGLHGLRFHDLRHTVITELAEMSVADHVLESISGHLVAPNAGALLAYPHRRQASGARRAGCRSRNAAQNGNGHGDSSKANEKAPDEGGIDALVEVSDELTSQSRHSLRLSGSPPHGKLLIPLEPHPNAQRTRVGDPGRRDVRVVEGARLESEVREGHQATPKRLNAHAISVLTLPNDHLVCVPKPRCFSRFQA